MYKCCIVPITTSKLDGRTSKEVTSGVVIIVMRKTLQCKSRIYLEVIFQINLKK